MAGSGNVAANDDGVDLLDHIDPRSRTFYSEAAAVAAYLISGKGRWQDSCRRVVTTALMHHAMVAEIENRPFFLTEIQEALEEACRRLRFRDTILATTANGVASKHVGSGIDA